MAHIDVSPRVAGFDANNVWHDPGNGQFAKPGWSTAKSLAIGLFDLVENLAKERGDKGLMVNPKGDGLKSIGVGSGDTVRARWLDSKHAEIEIVRDGRLIKRKVAWDTLDVAPNAPDTPDAAPDAAAPAGFAERLLGRVGNGDAELDAGLLRDAEALFNHDLGDGFTSKAESVQFNARGQIYASGVIVDQAGTAVGSFTRGIEASTTSDEFGGVEISHGTLGLGEGYQKRGIGSRFTAASMDAYREAGIDRVTVSASSSPGPGLNGAYTWAKTGFDWDTRAELAHVRTIGDLMIAADKDSVLGRRLRTLEDGPTLPEDFPTPLDIALDPVGAEVLKNSALAWSGVINLSEKARAPKADTPEIDHDAERLKAFGPAIEQLGIADWETTKPWEANQGDSNKPGWLVQRRVQGPDDSAHATSMYRGSRPVVGVSDAYWASDPEQRRAVLYHEAGHTLDRLIGPAEQQAAYDDLLRGPNFAPSKDNPGEMIAEGYALLHTDPQWLADNQPDLLPWLIEQADRVGMPVPDEARNVTGQDFQFRNGDTVDDVLRIPDGVTFEDRTGNMYVRTPGGAKSERTGQEVSMGYLSGIETAGGAPIARPVRPEYTIREDVPVDTPSTPDRPDVPDAAPDAAAPDRTAMDTPPNQFVERQIARGEVSMVRVGDVADKWTHEEGPLTRKLNESRQPDLGEAPLYDQIREAGHVSVPIHADSLWDDVDTPQENHVVLDGHHRVAALNDLNPDALIPVQWRGGPAANPYLTPEDRKRLDAEWSQRERDRAAGIIEIDNPTPDGLSPELAAVVDMFTSDGPLPDDEEERVMALGMALYSHDLGGGFESQFDSGMLSNNGNVVFEGSIVDENFDEVGKFTRVLTVDDNGHVEIYNDYIRIDADQQGKGLGSRFTAFTIDAAAANGIDTIRATAVTGEVRTEDGDLLSEMNGAYTWAKAGFDWDPVNGYHNGQEIGQRMLVLDPDSKIGAALATWETGAAPDGMPTPFEVALDPIGKRVLLGDAAEDNREVAWTAYRALSERARHPDGAPGDAPGDAPEATPVPERPNPDLPPVPAVRERIRQESLFAEDFGFTGTATPTLFDQPVEERGPLVVAGLDGLADALARVNITENKSRFSDRVGYTATMDPDDAAEVERFAARLFDHHTPTAASNTARIRPTALADGRPGFIVDGTLNLPDGTQIGVWERQIAADRTGDNIVWAVRGTGLTIAPEYRGQGYGPWFDTAADETLSDIGFDHIVVDAVTDPAADLNGAHTYATAGYDWDTSPAGVAAVNAIGADLLADNPDSKIGRALAEWDGTITDRTPTPLDVVQDPDGALLMRYGQTSWIGRRSFTGNRTDIVPVDDPEVDTLSGSSIGELLAHNAPYRPFPPSVQTAVENAAVVWFTHDLGDGYTSRVDTVRFARNSASATPVTVTGVIVDRDGNETRFTRILRRVDMSDPTAPTPGGDTIVVDHEPFVGPLDETVAATFDGTVFDKYRTGGGPQAAVVRSAAGNNMATAARSGFDWNRADWETVQAIGVSMLETDPDSEIGAALTADTWTTDTPTPLDVYADPVGRLVLSGKTGPVSWTGVRRFDSNERDPVSDPDPVDTGRWTVGEMVDPDNTALFPAGTEFSTDVDRYVALGDDMFDNEGVTITGERLRQQLGTEQVYIETIPNASGDEPTGTSVQRPGPEAVDLGSWSSVRPWEVQRDPNSSDPADLLLNGERAPSWLRFETGHGQEAAHRGDHIVVTPKFFDLPESARRSVMYHEAGHGLSDMMLDDGSAFELVDHLPAWGHLNGQTVPGEIAAEAYAILWTEPEWLDTNAPDIRDIVTAKAIEHGYPLPDATAPTAGRGQTVAPSGERRVPGWYVTAMSTDRQITVLDENGEQFTGRVTSVQPNAGTFEIESGDDFRVLPAASTVVVGSTGTDPWSDGGMDYRYRNTDYRIGGDGTVRKTGSLDPVAERTAERIRNQALGDAADLLEPLPQPAPDTAPDTVEPEPTVTPFRSRMEATFYNETERAAEIAEFEALPDDAMVVVFHGTSADRAANIEATRTVARSSREDHVSSVTQSNGLYVAPTYIDAERYAGKGGKVVEMVVPKWMIEPSPEAANKSAGQALYHTYEGAVIPEGSALNVVAIHDGRTPDTPDTVLNGPRPDTVFQNGYRNGAVIETRGGLPRGAGREYTITTEDGRQYRMIGSDTHGLRYHPIGEPTTSEDSWIMLPGDGPFTISDIVARTGDRREDGADSAVAALKNTLLATPSGEALAPLLWADDLSPAEWFSEDITERVGVADRTGSLPGVEDALKALRTETLRAARRGGEGLARRDPLPQRFYRIESVDIGVAGGKTRTETSVLWSTTPPTPDAPAYALTSGQMSHVLNNPDGTPAFAWTTNAIGIPLFDPPDVENPSSEQARSDVGVKFSTGMVDLDANMWETNRNYMSPRAALIDALTNGGYATPRNPRWSQPGTPVKSVVIGPDGAVSWTPDLPGTGDATPVDGEVVFSIDDPKLPSALTAATEHTNRAVMASTLASLQNGGGRGGQVGDVGGDYKRWLTDRGRDIHNNHFSGASTKADYDHDTGSFTPSETGEYTIDGNDAIRGFADLDPDGNPRLWLPADARARIVGLTVDYTKVRDKSVPLDERVASLAEQRTTLQRLLPGATASAWFQGPVGDNVVKAIIDGTADAATMEQVRRIELIQEFGTEIANLVAEQRAQSLLDRHHVDDDVNREILDAAFAGVFGRELQQYASRNTRPSNPAGQAIVDLAAQVEGNPPPGVPLFRVESVHVDPNLDDPTSPTFDWGFTVARPDGSARVRVTIGRQTSNQAVVVSFSGEVGHRGDSTGPITLHTDGHFDDVRRLHTVLSANADIAPPTNEIAETIAANRRRSRTAPRTPAGPVQPYAPEHTVEAFSTLLADAGIDGFGLYGFSVDGDGIPQIRGDRAELTAVRTGSKDGVRHAKFVFVTEPGTYYERTFTVTVKATNEVELNRKGTRRVVGRINSSDNDGAYDAAVALAARLKQHAPTVDKPKVERETRVRVDASSVVDSGPMRIFHDIMGSLGIDMSTDETVRIGNGGQGALKPISEANQNLAETARAGLAVFPRSWTTALSANRPVRLQLRTGNVDFRSEGGFNRAASRAGEPDLISTPDISLRPDYADVAGHEFGHTFQHFIPGLLAAEQWHLMARLAANPAKSKPKPFGRRSRYGRQDYLYEDEFARSYSGRTYDGGISEAREVLTTAVQGLYTDSSFGSDPRLQGWAIGMMALLDPTGGGNASIGTTTTADRVAREDMTVAELLGGTFNADTIRAVLKDGGLTDTQRAALRQILDTLS